MNYNVISSSSKGNAIILEEKILLDCGVSFSRIRAALRKIKIIFISHQHQDHILRSTIRKIAYEHPHIKFITGSKEVVRILVANGVRKNNVFLLRPDTWYNVGLCKVKIDKLEHDVDNYALHIEYNCQKCIYIVDTSSVDNIVAENYELYLIEANYKETILNEHLQNCNEDEKIYLQRVPLTHLSWEKSNDFLIKNMGNNSQYQYIHESDYNYQEDK